MTEEELKEELFRVGNINMELHYKLDEAEAIIEVYKKAFEMACWLLSMSSECFNGYCPLEKTVSEERYGYKCEHCPDCNNEKEWQEHFLKKAREE